MAFEKMDNLKDTKYNSNVMNDMVWLEWGLIENERRRDRGYIHNKDEANIATIENNNNNNVSIR